MPLRNCPNNLMCLSIVYKNKKDEKNVLMRNVMRIESSEGLLTLTDLMERKMEVKGRLAQANLVDGFVIVDTEGK